MMRFCRCFCPIVFLLLIRSAGAADPDTTVVELRRELTMLRTQLEEQRKEFEQRIRVLERRLDDTPAEPQADDDAEPDLSTVLNRARAQAESSDESSRVSSEAGSAWQSLNPDVSAIVDTFYYSDNTKEGIQHTFGELSGFGHSHGGDHDHGHNHAEMEDGFNLRHLELHLSADIDPYFKGWAIAAVSEDGAELEEAVIQTTSLPWGLQLQGGKFYSDFSRINAQHAHEWEFVDAPLVHHLLFGDHGLNEKGLQLSWLAPTPFKMLFGLEALQGNNDPAFQHLGSSPLPYESGPRLFATWLKLAPNLPAQHGLELGLAAGRGEHQEEHDALINTDWTGSGIVTPGADGGSDHWLDGNTTFLGADVVYKYDAGSEYGVGDWTLQSGYLWRRKELELVDHLLPAAPVGEDRVDTQDGYYAQAVYGFRPRWRAGVRWEQIGLTNRVEFPDGGDDSFGASSRASVMVDFSPSEFSRLRLQVARGDYETAEGDEDVWQLYLQWTISLGAHGAHTF